MSRLIILTCDNIHGILISKNIFHAVLGTQWLHLCYYTCLYVYFLKSERFYKKVLSLTGSKWNIVLGDGDEIGGKITEKK